MVLGFGPDKPGIEVKTMAEVISWQNKLKCFLFRFGPVLLAFFGLTPKRFVPIDVNAFR